MSRNDGPRGRVGGKKGEKAKRGRLTPSLVALSSGAILAVYAAGYANSRAAEQALVAVDAPTSPSSQPLGLSTAPPSPAA